MIENLKNLGHFALLKRIPYTENEEGISMKQLKLIGMQLCQKFNIDSDNSFLYENIVKWAISKDMKAIKLLSGNKIEVKEGDVKKGLYIAGRTGTGKSMAIEILRLFLAENDFYYLLGDEKKPLKFTTIRADEIVEQYNETGQYKQYCSMPILSIEDLGSESNEGIFMGARENILKKILERRGDNSKLITLITSNLLPDSDLFTKRYGDRVVSRIKQMCNEFILFGPDRRLN